MLPGLLVGDMKCHGIKCPGLTVAGRIVVEPVQMCMVYQELFSVVA